MTNYTFIDEGINAPLGFSALGESIGIKDCKKDFAVILSDVPCVCAGVFTKNKACAAPVLWDKKIIENGNDVRAVVINSGNANAATGKEGYNNTVITAELFANKIGAKAEEILVCSTGVIGVQLQMDKISAGIEANALQTGKDRKSAKDAAQAILTTDTFIKEYAMSLNIGGKEVKIAGISKGSGMIHPNMATTLAFITTDALISKKLVNQCLKEAADLSFNMISVDGDTSTNDTMFLMANGLAGNAILNSENEDYLLFKNAVIEISKRLAKDVAKDGEGATKLIEINVTGAKTEKDAKMIARSVSTSNLVKTAMFGRDANWGRVLCAMGYADADFNIDNVNLTFESCAGSVLLMKDGAPVVFDEELALKVLTEKEVFINILLTDGKAKATAWGCDLTYEYVKINGEYRS